MTTIMAIGNSEGTRRCDERCHGAQHPECDCICGGRYHGKGGRAQELLQEDLQSGMWGEGLKKFAETAQAALDLGTAS